MTALRRGPSRLVRRVAMLVLALAAIGIAADRAITSLTPRSWSYGTLTGTLEAVGDPSGVGPRTLSGTITGTTSNRGILSFPVGASGRFSVQAVVGTYTVTARSPQFKGGTAICHALGPVIVSKGMTSKVTVDCGAR